MTTVKVALLQHLEKADPADLIGQAATMGADIAVFPEMLSNGYAAFDAGDPEAEAAWRTGAQALNGPFVDRFRDAARQHRIHVVATLLEAADPDPFNAALLIDPAGDIVLHHRKVHICDFDTPESACGRGDRFDVTTVETAAGPVTVGLMICMDREYVDSAATLSAKGAEIILVPNCCDMATDPVVGDVRIAHLRGRAFESVTGIALANYPTPRCDGHSLAVDPLGRVIAIAGPDPTTLLADFDLAALRRTREKERFRWRQPPDPGSPG